jgi:hypothetical protein
MSGKLVIQIPEPKDGRTCLLAVEELFEQIVELHGFATACGLFHSQWREPSRSQIKAYKNAQLAVQFYRMAAPNKDKLAVLLAKQNETRPTYKKWGPNGTTNPTTMRKQIVRVLKQKKYREAGEAAVKARPGQSWLAKRPGHSEE